MECFTSSQCHPKLSLYLKRPDIRDVHHDPSTGRWTGSVDSSGHPWNTGGIHTYIQSRFIPQEAQGAPRRTYRTVKLGSSKATGIATDKAICRAVGANGAIPSRCNMYAKAALTYLRNHNYVLQAAQVPVLLRHIDRITSADLITLNPLKTGLVLWEIKTGWPKNRRSPPQMNAPLHHVKATRQNAWQLQLLYSHNALKSAGLPILASYVLLIYREQPKNGQARVVTKRIRLKKWAIDFANGGVVVPNPPLKPFIDLT